MSSVRQFWLLGSSIWRELIGDQVLRLLISMSGSSRLSSSCGGLGLGGGVGVGGDPSAFGMTSSVAMLGLSFI